MKVKLIYQAYNEDSILDTIDIELNTNNEPTPELIKQGEETLLPFAKRLYNATELRFLQMVTYKE